MGNEKVGELSVPLRKEKDDGDKGEKDLFGVGSVIFF
jgi:hypothetical protein